MIESSNNWSFWQNWAASENPAAMMQQWQQSGLLDRIPELAAMPQTPQDPQWHPEGDVWTHTKLVCQYAAKLSRRKSLPDAERDILMLAALCHDFGKPDTTAWIDGRYRSPGHAQLGASMSSTFLLRIGAPPEVVSTVPALVREHLAHTNLRDANKRQIRRLIERLQPAKLEQLWLLLEADLGGRPPLPVIMPAYLTKVGKLADEIYSAKQQPAPLINGRHLQELGLKPGPGFRSLLQDCYEAQLAGKITTVTEGLQFLKQHIVERSQ